MTNLPSNSIAISLDSSTQIEINSVSNTLDSANFCNIDNKETCELAAGQLKNIMTRKKSLDTKRKELTKPLHDLKKQWIDFFQPAIDTLNQAEVLYKKAINTYTQKQEKIRRDAEVVAQEKARKEREKLEERALKAEASGKTEKSESLQMQAEMVQIPIINSASTMPKGVYGRETWSAEVTDKIALLRGVINGKIPHQALNINTTFLNTQARALKKELNYPGVKAVSSRGISART